MPTATINNLYIESVYIDNNNDNSMTSTDGYNGASGGDITSYDKGNHLNGVINAHTDLNTDYGSKWVVQLTNGSGSDINFDTGANRWWLRIDIQYKNSSNVFSNYTSTLTKRFYIEGGTLSNGASLYLGWGNTDTAKGIYDTASGISDIEICNVSSNVPTDTLDGKLIPPVKDDGSTSVYRLLPDQIDGSGDTICTTRFILYKNTAYKDIFGVGSSDNDGSGLNYSPKRHILFDTGANNTGSSRSVSTGALSRDPTQSGTVPTTTFDSTKFVYRSGNGDGILAGTAVGDPHITTLSGITYKFDYLGYFRMLDNNSSNDNQRLIINGLSEYGEGIRWKDNQYITKIFIYYGCKYAIIDTGFRGTKAKVIENNGLDIEETGLEFHHSAEVHCFDCNRVINYQFKNGIKKHIRKYNHKLLEAVRNNLEIKLLGKGDEFIINVSNINQYNLQPCRIFIKPVKISTNNYTGTYIHRKYALNSKINDLKNIDLIECKNNYKLINLPKLERRPELINKKFI